jgi:hypothetical protein
LQKERLLFSGRLQNFTVISDKEKSRRNMSIGYFFKKQLFISSNDFSTRMRQKQFFPKPSLSTLHVKMQPKQAKWTSVSEERK